jgi:hypothetical protein
MSSRDQNEDERPSWKKKIMEPIEKKGGYPGSEIGDDTAPMGPPPTEPAAPPTEPAAPPTEPAAPSTEPVPDEHSEPDATE